MAFDAQTAWMRLGAYVASKPNHGRQDMLSAMARIADECTIPEEDFARALRLTLPALAEALFDARTTAPAATAASVPEGDRVGHARQALPTIAA